MGVVQFLQDSIGRGASILSVVWEDGRLSLSLYVLSAPRLSHLLKLV